MSKLNKSSLKSPDVHLLRKLIREEIEEQLGNRGGLGSRAERDGWWGEGPQMEDRSPRSRRKPEADGWGEDWLSGPLDPPAPSKRGRKRPVDVDVQRNERRTPESMEDWFAPLDNRPTRRR